MSDLVLASDEGRVRILRLNRPDARNALSAALRTELIQCLHEAGNNGGVGAIVLTGEGSAFAAGADLRELLARSSDEQRHFLQPPHIYSVIESLAKPVVAAINGHALGAGLELATACDVRVCSADAKLGQPETTLGLIPGGGGTQRLERLIGHGAASRLVLTGEAVAAEEALRMGLVDAIVPKDKVLAEAVRLAGLMARNDQSAIAAAKRTLAAARDLPYAQGLEQEIDEFVKLHGLDTTRHRILNVLDKK